MVQIPISFLVNKIFKYLFCNLIAQSVICQQNNFRLSVKLVSGNKADNTNHIVTNEEMKTKKHSRKCKLNLIIPSQNLMD
ncbi:unnamed protein product [Schistosoma margrebowiei]|uniref:Uncharacterized protein n=1 Tax=Schistosoma margrebowiei TaxID=48269 RepID=A0A3P8B4S2_9TREM|nr:unnamed protein product [Schistosoma margrebowiei]